MAEILKTGTHVIVTRLSENGTPIHSYPATVTSIRGDLIGVQPEPKGKVRSQSDHHAQTVRRAEVRKA